MSTRITIITSNRENVFVEMYPFVFSSMLLGRDEQGDDKGQYVQIGAYCFALLWAIPLIKE